MTSKDHEFNVGNRAQIKDSPVCPSLPAHNPVKHLGMSYIRVIKVRGEVACRTVDALNVRGLIL